MSEHEDGGPAFPLPMARDHQGILITVAELNESKCGMSLRDWFAGQALNGLHSSTPDCDFGHLWRNDKGEIRILSGANHPHEDATNWRHIAGPNERLAAQCYLYADAMLTARKEKP